tara:strand:- start:282 stop:479 length:198 start_codon:yes stop_codon:yes gene_type:complete
MESKSLEELKKIVKSSMVELDRIQEVVKELKGLSEVVEDRIENLADDIVNTLDLIEYREAEGDQE